MPLQNLSKFAAWFLLVVLLIGGVILIVFHIFNIRERKYEIGVLTAIGMRKSRVALQFLTELFVVTFAFLLLGTAIGGAASVPVTTPCWPPRFPPRRPSRPTGSRISAGPAAWTAAGRTRPRRSPHRGRGRLSRHGPPDGQLSQ